MIGLIGQKVGMSQIFDEEGRQVPVTLVRVGPCYVVEVKNQEKHGYTSVQLGFEKAKEQRLNKPSLGIFKKAKLPALKVLREIRTVEVEGLSQGVQVKADNFEVGDYVDVKGVSIGRGYQGVVKRHHFKGGEHAHGSKMGREAGSIGQGKSNPKRVPKGRRMAGHMGDENITVHNLKVVKVDAAHDLIAIHGAVPGHEGNYVLIQSSLKRGTKRKWKVSGDKKASAAKVESSEQASDAGSQSQQAESKDENKN